ncbi:MAG TPA: MarC family protein [Casimicrobiaceae bacterium]
MASLLIALKIVPTIFVALFPVVNPIGSTLVLYGMIGGVDDKTWMSASRKLAINAFLLLSFFFFFGGFILKLFGISVPVVQFSGGLVVASIGWSLLNQKSEKRSSADVHELDSATSLETKMFYPLTFPITVGPGSLAVVLTFSAHLNRESELLVTLEQAGAIAGIFSIALVTGLCYSRFKFIAKKFSPAAALALSRILAFFVFCIGVEIAWTGWRALNA